MHHDGGLEDRSGSLETQVAWADVVFFPVDCVSHNAVGTVKRVARYLGKPYVAPRSSGMSSLAAALRQLAAERRGGSARNGSRRRAADSRDK